MCNLITLKWKIRKYLFMNNYIVMVFTRKSPEEIINKGGSGNWSASRKKLEKCEYFVATKSNTLQRYSSDNTDIRKDSAFLVGKITKITEISASSGKKRFFIQISEYAEINQPGVWAGNRNPISYTNTDSFKEEHGLDIESLEWKKCPAQSIAVETAHRPSRDDVEALTIAKAKAGLAKTLEIPTNCIEITIKA